MQKIKLTTLLCLLIITAKSQPYGIQRYPHANSFLSSGDICIINRPGFIMGGYRPVADTAKPNFYIDKTGPGGLFATAADNPFSIEYIIRQRCASTTAVINCQGISVIEALNGGSNEAYAVAGTFDQTCFFSTLDSTGTPITSVAFELPSTAVKLTKPRIVQDTITGIKSYYICGSYKDISDSIGYTYVICCDNLGTVNWSYTYDLGTGTGLYAADMLLSPWGSGDEPVIVGKGLTLAAGNKGFCLRLSNTGAVFNLDMFGQAGGVGNDEFGCITVANSSTPATTGFVVGGYSDMNPSVGQSWFVKFDQHVSGIYSPFNSLFANYLDPSTGYVVDVIERYSAHYAAYEYYGLYSDPYYGMVVMKLDETGNAFRPAGTVWTEKLNDFAYLDLSAAPAVVPIAGANSLSYHNGVGSERGIQIFGTRDNTTGGDHLLVEAYFNGPAVCDVGEDTLGVTSSGPSTHYAFLAQSVNINSGPTLCTDFALNLNYLTPSNIPSPITICSENSSVYGSDNKTGYVTAISKTKALKPGFEVFPNPASGRVTINYELNGDGAVQFELYNTLGQQVKKLYEHKQAGGAQSLELDLSTLGIKNGIYILQAKMNGSEFKQKIIYTGE